MEVYDTTTINLVPQTTMQNEMLAVEEAMNIEVGTVKTETVEVENELFGIEQTRGPTAKYANADETVINRSKEGNIVEDWRNHFEMQDIKVKLEENDNCENLKTKFEEAMIKQENDDLNDADGEIAVNRIKKEQVDNDWKNELDVLDTTVKLEEDVNCEDLKIKAEEVIIKEENDDLKDASGEKAVNRSLEIPNWQNQHLKTEDKLTCTYCNISFICKTTLDEHIVRKHQSVSTDKLNTCVHCNATFKSKRALDGHTLRKHPGSIGSISSKIHECIHCTFKTVKKVHLDDHMLKHPETASGYKFLTCIHCNGIYKRKVTLDDHILRQHPEHIASVSSKIHECTRCEFKTVKKARLAQHMLNHPETGNKLSICIHCNAEYKYKTYLDDHILRQHPEYMASVSGKVHQCTQCSYKTVMKTQLHYHMLKHPETAVSYKFNTCIHCNAKYRRKINLDNHILKQHPAYIASVSSKIHECPRCTFKTVVKAELAPHFLKHFEFADR